jgi:hypothetical protein
MLVTPGLVAGGSPHWHCWHSLARREQRQGCSCLAPQPLGRPPLRRPLASSWLWPPPIGPWAGVAWPPPPGTGPGTEVLPGSSGQLWQSPPPVDGSPTALADDHACQGREPCWVNAPRRFADSRTCHRLPGHFPGQGAVCIRSCHATLRSRCHDNGRPLRVSEVLRWAPLAVHSAAGGFPTASEPPGCTDALVWEHGAPASSLPEGPVPGDDYAPLLGYSAVPCLKRLQHALGNGSRPPEGVQFSAAQTRPPARPKNSVHFPARKTDPQRGALTVSAPRSGHQIAAGKRPLFFGPGRFFPRTWTAKTRVGQHFPGACREAASHAADSAGLSSCTGR